MAVGDGTDDDSTEVDCDNAVGTGAENSNNSSNYEKDTQTSTDSNNCQHILRANRERAVNRTLAITVDKSETETVENKSISETDGGLSWESCANYRGKCDEVGHNGRDDGAKTRRTLASFGLNTSHPLWRIFLDSQCASATLYLNIHISSQNYFHSPTPWRSSNSLSLNVSRLLDSFRPGSSSYSPFQRKEFDLVHSSVIYTNNSNEQTRQLFRPREIIEMRRNNPSENSGHHHDREQQQQLTREEENRRRLYLNLGRPRPFYRSHSQPDTPPEAANQPAVVPNSPPVTPSPTPRRRLVKSLQNLVRRYLILRVGLTKLSKALRENHFLPEVVTDYVLTLPCNEFKEIGVLGLRSATYSVRSLLDGKAYTAVYATSEMDKAVSNLWEEERDWLELSIPGLMPVLGLAVDPLTQNIFYIIPADLTPLSEYLETWPQNKEEKRILASKIVVSVKKIMMSLKRHGKNIGCLKMSNIYLDSEHGIVLENGVLMKSKPHCDVCNCCRNTLPGVCISHRGDKLTGGAGGVECWRGEMELDQLSPHSVEEIVAHIMLDESEILQSSDIKKAEDLENSYKKEVAHIMDESST